MAVNPPAPAVLDELRSLDTGRPTLRRFGTTVGGVLAMIGAIVAWRIGTLAGTAPLVLLGVGHMLIFTGILIPRALRLPYRAWMALALILGFVMTRVLLTVVYFLVVTPIGLVLRLLGRDPMHSRPDPDMETYWIPREPVEDSRTGLTRYG